MAIDKETAAQIIAGVLQEYGSLDEEGIRALRDRTNARTFYEAWSEAGELKGLVQFCLSEMGAPDNTVMVTLGMEALIVVLRQTIRTAWFEGFTVGREAASREFTGSMNSWLEGQMGGKE